MKYPAFQLKIIWVTNKIVPFFNDRFFKWGSFTEIHVYFMLAY